MIPKQSKGVLPNKRTGKMRLRLVIYLIFIGKVLANNSIKVDIHPRVPQVNSSYTVTFHIMTKSDEEPIVNFTPEGSEVQGPHSRGVSMRTKFLNGKLFTEKEVTYSYELVSSNAGFAKLKDIKVTIGKREHTHPNVRIRITRDLQRKKDFFAEAKVSKEEIFVGEGITVKYYIYSRGLVKGYELRSYPKLKKFLKRFIDLRERSKNVEIGGEIFRRDLLYAARVFAERPGRYRIDPISLKVKYSKNRGQNPLSLNFSFQRILKKNIQSRPIKIKVRPLPPSPPNTNFTGLVGKHSFKLRQGKTRYLVNEAIELELEVIGGGALEAYNGPDIYHHPDLEEFETSSDLRVLNSDKASKIYEYTYLARNSFKSSKRQIGLTYFDPETESYKEVLLIIPGLSVLGGAISQVSNPLQEKENKKKSSEGPNGPSSEVVGPIFNDSFFGNLITVKYINYFLGTVLIIFLLSLFLKTKKKTNLHIKEAEQVVNSLKQGEGTYSDIFRLFHLVRGESGSPLDIFIKTQGFSRESQEYLLKLVESAESFSYFKGDRVFRFKYSRKPFQELLVYIAKKGV